MSYFVVKSLKKSYGKSLILKDISFDIDKGQVLSIIGRSGCGKTTLLRSLNYLETIDSGEVYLENELLLSNEFPKKENDIIKKRIHYGLVFQSFNLFPQYTVYQNIELPLKLMEAKREKENLPPLLNRPIEEEIMDLLDKVGLQDKRDSFPSQLSGGQCQRIAIARAMALKPDILCFDEPTSALDPELTGEVLKVILELKEKFHLTMIIVTHEMSFARRISDKVMFMDNGEIVDYGSPEEVFNSTKERTKAFLQSSIL
ncbi:MAG: amino acid ABC transporter ATP-binding protein [Bacilli bacterium]|nr:amino acid ABC transporter ATP-binding protein [Bacilli bacterium]